MKRFQGPAAPRFAFGLLAMAVVATTSLVLAKGSGPDTGPRVIPYQGYLEKDGAAVAGTVPISFVVSDGASTWTGASHDVAVYAGAFSWLIGQDETTPLPAWVFSSQAVTVQVAIDGVLLQGAQRIYPVPYAYWSAEGRDFEIAGTMTVTGTARISNIQGSDAAGNLHLYADSGKADGRTYLNYYNGRGVRFGNGAQGWNTEIQDNGSIRGSNNSGNLHLDADTAKADGRIYLGYNNGRGVRFGDGAGTWKAEVRTDGTIQGGNAIYNNTADGQLGVSSNFAFRDTGDTWLRLRTGVNSETYADLAVNSLYVGGAIQFGSALRHSSTLAAHNGHWGDWTGWHYCGRNEYVCGYQIRMEAPQGGGDDSAMNSAQLACCPFGP